MHEVLFVFTEPCMYGGFLAEIERIKNQFSSIWSIQVQQTLFKRYFKFHIL